MMTLWNQEGRLLTYVDSAVMIVEASEVPIYSCWDLFLGLGIVGGKLVSGVAQRDGKRHGFGLGLIKNLGGLINVYSEKGEG